MKSFPFIALLAALFLTQTCNALVHHLQIHKDDRNVFKIETFGFIAGGRMNISVSDFSITLSAKDKIKEADTNGANYYKVGFLMRKANSESTAQQDLEKMIEHKDCILDHIKEDDVFFDMSEKKDWKKLTSWHVVNGDNSMGLYSLIFARCAPTGNHLTSFKLDAVFYNPGPNYLSAGDKPLPWLYFSFFVAFVGCLIGWLYIISQQSRNTFAIHHLMSALLVLKCATLLIEGVRYHNISMYGVSSEGWSILYFIFSFVKGVMLFLVILLIGSGWTLMKSYLNSKEKKIIFVVLILQVIMVFDLLMN